MVETEEQRKRRLEKGKLYYQQHREEMKATAYKRYHEKRDWILARDKELRLQNHDKVVARSRAYWWKNREHLLVKQKESYQRNKAKWYEHGRLYREKKKQDPVWVQKEKIRTKERAIAYRKKYPERIAASRRRAKMRDKLRVMNLLGGAFCQRCGCDDLDFLEVHHIGGGGNKEWKKLRVYSFRMHELILSGKRGLAGLGVLCKICNALDFLERKFPAKIRRYRITWVKSLLDEQQRQNLHPKLVQLET